MGVITTARKDPDTFYVVLTNISNKPQSTWETGNSWGDGTISFDFTMPNGMHFLTTAIRQNYTRNIPSTYVIPPGEHEVYPIKLDSDWENRPPRSGDGVVPVTVKAIYDVRRGSDSDAFHVWTGRVESASYHFSLWYW